MNLLLVLPLILLAGYTIGWLCYIRGNVAGYRECAQMRVEPLALREDVQ